MEERACHCQAHEPVDHEGEDPPPEPNSDEMHWRSLTLNLPSNLRNMVVTRGL